MKKQKLYLLYFIKTKAYFDELKEKVFVKSWQFVGHESILPININTYPFEFIKNYIEEPLLLVKNEDEKIICLSNVCTHRANIIVHNPSEQKRLEMSLSW